MVVWVYSSTLESQFFPIAPCELKNHERNSFPGVPSSATIPQFPWISRFVRPRRVGTIRGGILFVETLIEVAGEKVKRE